MTFDLHIKKCWAFPVNSAASSEAHEPHMVQGEAGERKMPLSLAESAGHPLMVNNAN